MTGMGGVPWLTTDSRNGTPPMPVIRDILFGD